MREKVYTSNDGLLQLRSSDITHVCIAPSLFPLLQYLLLVDENVAKNHTYYFFSNVVPLSIVNQLVCSYYIQQPDSSLLVALKKRIHKLRIAFFKKMDFPFLRTARIFAFDYPVLCAYIGNRPYEMLSDAPQCFTYNMREQSEEYQRQIKRRHTFIWWLQKIVYGDVYVDYYGNNKWCKVIHLTEENQSPILEAKKTCIQSLEELWCTAPETKKLFILSLFNITKYDIQYINSKPIIFFSQPLIEDCKLSEKEYCNILERLFNHYNKSEILVKTHPRDKFNYTKYFPEIAVFSKSVNSQLLHLLGHTPQRVVTFFSSAVEVFPDTVECDFYGTHIHPSVYAIFGDYKLQRPVNNMKL